MYRFFAAAPKGFEHPLSQELEILGAQDIRESVAGVYFQADLKTAYTITMWSRLISRITLILFEGKVENIDDCYQEAYAIDWPSHFDHRSTFAVDFVGTNDFINNTQFGALKIKDAVVDRFRDDDCSRPSIDKSEPDFRINARIKRNYLTIGFNFSGQGMHQRGYRFATGEAPLKENLACALLMRSQWHKNKSTIVDPFCGSGTILIEAAMWAADVAPALKRESFGFRFWHGHQQNVWQEVVADAQERAEKGKAACDITFYGSDISYDVIEKAKDNARAADVDGLINFSVKDARHVTAPEETGLLLSNPPFGERLGQYNSLLHLFFEFGQQLKQNFGSWKVSLLSSDAELLSALKLKYDKQVKMYNGSLECVFTSYQVRANDNASLPAKEQSIAEPFVNRLKKNEKQLKKWVKQEGIDSYRLYDADIPEYNVAIDRYKDYLIVQEYAAPADIPDAIAQKRLNDVLLGLPRAIDIDLEKIIVKQRRRQRGKEQYQRQLDQDLIVIVNEYGARLKVNLTQYLDTGLFLDHRLTRKLVGDKSKKKDVLNLFAYTGTASVHAALGGARSVTTVDMSKTYLRWARENFELNGLTGRNYSFIQDDCLQWILDEDRQYDLIFVDPPTFSNSKRMEQTFDVQRDYLDLLADLKPLLKSHGEIIFSNNKRKFKLDHQALADVGLTAKNLDHQLLPLDYKRNPHIHNCWLVTHDNKR